MKRAQDPLWRMASGIAVALGLIVGGVFFLTPSTSTTIVTEARAAQPSAAGNEAARGLSHAFRAASEAIVPAVVTIETRSKPRAAPERKGGKPQANPFKGTPFEDFFNDNDPRLREFGGSRPRREGTGSGVIVDKSGIILTNNHVVEGADEVIVRLADGREFTAADIKTDPQTDLAVLRIPGAGTLPAAIMGDSDKLATGDWVIAVGNPFGLDLTVSAGIISGKGRELGAGQRTRFLQTDAAINPGNSGGPLVDLDGAVIGINTAIASNSGGYQGIGFAIPINLAKWVMGQLIDTGSVRRAYLGIGIEEINQDLADQLGVKRGQGVLVSEVHPDTPAAAAGLRSRDVITTFAGTSVRTPRDLQEVVERCPIDSKQQVNVLRDGKALLVEVLMKGLPDSFGRVARRNNSSAQEDLSNQGYSDKTWGLEVTNMTTKEAEQLGFSKYQGVLVSDVEADSPAAEAGLRTGMLVMEVDKQPVENIEQFRAAISKLDKADRLLLLVRTDSGNRFVVLKK